MFFQCMMTGKPESGASVYDDEEYIPPAVPSQVKDF